MARALIGLLMVVAGLALALWTNRALGWRRLLWMTDEPPHPGRPRLVLAGPYRLVRHPFFLSLLMLLGGAAAATGTSLLWAAAAVAVVLLPVLARREERRLADRFGEAYRRYQVAVPFILPMRRRGR